MAVITFKMGDNIFCDFEQYSTGDGKTKYTFDIYGTGYMYDSALDFREVGGGTRSYGTFIIYVCQTNVTIPVGIKSIADYCFASIGSGVWAGDQARLSGVQNIYICKDVEYIGEYAFRKTFTGGGIRNVFVYGDNPKLTRIKQGAFYSQIDLVTCNFRGLVDTIGNNAFQYCHSLESINLADNWEFDEDYFDAYRHGTFENCYKLKSISEHNTIVDISGNSNYNYRYCDSLTYITLNNPIDEHPSARDKMSNGLGLTAGLWGTDEHGDPVSGLDVEYDEDGNLITEIDTEFDEYFDINYILWKDNIHRSVSRVSKFKVYVYHMGRRIELKGGDTGDIPVAHEGHWKYLRCAQDSENPAYSPIHFAHNGQWYQFKY